MKKTYRIEIKDQDSGVYIPYPTWTTLSRGVAWGICMALDAFRDRGGLLPRASYGGTDGRNDEFIMRCEQTNEMVR